MELQNAHGLPPAAVFLPQHRTLSVIPAKDAWPESLLLPELPPRPSQGPSLTGSPRAAGPSCASRPTVNRVAAGILLFYVLWTPRAGLFTGTSQGLRR